MKIAVVGAGAIGGFIGTRLALAGEDVTFMVRGANLDAIRANGTDAEIDVFSGLGHGFGLGEGTAAEGWLDRAVAFWQRRV